MDLLARPSTSPWGRTLAGPNPEIKMCRHDSELPDRAAAAVVAPLAITFAARLGRLQAGAVISRAQQV